MHSGHEMVVVAVLTTVQAAQRQLGVSSFNSQLMHQYSACD